MRYYSGFRGDSSQLLVTKDEKVLFTDFRYTEQAENETDFEVVETGGAGRAEAIFARAGGERIGIDLAQLPVGEYRAYLQHTKENKRAGYIGRGDGAAHDQRRGRNGTAGAGLFDVRTSCLRTFAGF